ncbi:MAG: hypothetical protein ACPLRW_13055 [Moorellales bacterium]
MEGSGRVDQAGGGRVRPHFCIVKDCAPVRSFDDVQRLHLELGGSFICAGVMDKRRVCTVDECEHDNPWCLCFYTPCKGWVRLMIDRVDVEIIAGLIRRLKRHGKAEVADNVVRREGDDGEEAPAADTAAQNLR